jgi:hypothetical protein
LDNNNIFLVLGEGIFTTFLVLLTWVIFRADTISQGFKYVNGIFSASLFSSPGDLPLKEICLTLVFIIIEYFQRKKAHAMQINGIRYVWLRWILYVSLVFIILLFGGGAQKFIYFQF